jgi:hypothetical protein
MSRRDRKTRYPCLLCVFVWGTSGEQLFRGHFPRIRAHRASLTALGDFAITRERGVVRFDLLE